MTNTTASTASTASTGENLATKMLTGKGRVSYPQVFAPKAVMAGQTPKYSISLVFSKSDKETLAKAKACIAAAFESEKNGKLKGKTMEVLVSDLKNFPLKDGDKMKPNDPVYKGCYYINAKSVTKPTLLDQAKSEITSEDVFYAGCYARASINFYAYNINGGIGIAAGLNNIQKLADGEKLSARPDAQDEFDAVESDDDFSM